MATGSDKIAETAAKLSMLGNTVKVTEENALMMHSVLDGKRYIMWVDGKGLKTSREYDAIRHLPDSPYYIVKYDKLHRIWNRKTAVYSAGYLHIKDFIRVNDSVFTAVATLKDGTKGIIDTEDNNVSPFQYHSIDTYKISGEVVRISRGYKTIKLYDKYGKYITASDKIGEDSIIVCSDWLLLENKTKEARYAILKLNGELVRINNAEFDLDYSSNIAIKDADDLTGQKYISRIAVEYKEVEEEI